jgi:hypothetical protein
MWRSTVVVAIRGEIAPAQIAPGTVDSRAKTTVTMVRIVLSESIGRICASALRNRATSRLIGLLTIELRK